MAKNTKENDKYMHIRGEHPYSEHAYSPFILDIYDSIHRTGASDLKLGTEVPVINAVHKVGSSELKDIKLIVAIDNVIHDQFLDVIKPGYVLPIYPSCHKQGTNREITPRFRAELFGGAIHKLEVALTRRTTITPVCERYLNSGDWHDRWLDTPYCDRYLETPYDYICRN